jgi:uncharacterized protein (DUF3820 family)
MWQLMKKMLLKPLKNMIVQRRLRGRSHAEVFTDIYKHNKWGDPESISGPGSTLKETAHVRVELEDLFKKYEIRTIIDLPCGDFNWFKEIDYPFEHYIGCDIIDELIATNTKKYGSVTRHFKKIDCLNDQVDDADMILVRDLLIHFSADDILKFFGNLRRSNIKYIITSHFLNLEKNQEIVTGQGRLVNLTKPPFNFPEPQEWFLERSQVFDRKWHDSKALAVWELEIIHAFLDTSRVSDEAA